MSDLKAQDSLRDFDVRTTFVFNDYPLRGSLVNLSQAWRDVLRPHPSWPRAAADTLGRFLAATVLMAGSLKFKGELKTQISGSGYLNMLSAVATSDGTCRGTLSVDDSKPIGPEGARDLGALVGRDTPIVIALLTDKAAPYLGVAPIEGGDAADALANYLARSEQVDSALSLAADDSRIAGLLLQKMPDAKSDEGDGAEIEAIKAMARSAMPEELLQTPAPALLRRLFGEYDLTALRQDPIVFRCSCGREKAAAGVVAMGLEGARELLDERGGIEVRCDNCLETYLFEEKDVDNLFRRPAR